LYRIVKTMAAAFVRRAVGMLDAWKANESTKILLVVGGVVGLATYQTLSRAATKDGHNMLSSEKPQALRNESTRSLDDEKAKLAAAKEKGLL
jgi:hypothetical protein